MQIDRRVTNGLAWAGALIVVAIPTADLVTGQLMGGGERPAQVAMVDAPVAVPASKVAPMPAPLSQRPAAPQVAAATPAKVDKPATPVVAKPSPTTQVAAAPAAQAPATNGNDAVSNYLKSGRALPSYITDSAAASKPAVTTQPAPSSMPAQVATTPAPTQAPVVTEDPVVVGAIEPQHIAPTPMPLSMRPRPVATATPTQTVVRPSVVPPAELTADDLSDWESGPLSEFLAKRQGRAAQAKPVPADYDSDGFFLDEGPNRNGDRLIGPAAPFGFWDFQ